MVLNSASVVFLPFDGAPGRSRGGCLRCQQSRSLQLAVKVLYGFVAFLVVAVAVLVSLGEPPPSLARLNCICKHEVLETRKKTSSSKLRGELRGGGLVYVSLRLKASPAGHRSSLITSGSAAVQREALIRVLFFSSAAT